MIGSIDDAKAWPVLRRILPVARKSHRQRETASGNTPDAPEPETNSNPNWYSRTRYIDSSLAHFFKSSIYFLYLVKYVKKT